MFNSLRQSCTIRSVILADEIPVTTLGAQGKTPLSVKAVTNSDFITSFFACLGIVTEKWSAIANKQHESLLSQSEKKRKKAGNTNRRKIWSIPHKTQWTAATAPKKQWYSQTRAQRTHTHTHTRKGSRQCGFMANHIKYHSNFLMSDIT